MVLTVVFGLLGGFAGVAASALMFRQNSLLAEQNVKLEMQNEQIIAQSELLEAQNRSVVLQTQIAEQQILPQFLLHAVQVKNAAEEKFTDNKIIVDNQGEVARELDTEFAVFLEVELYPQLPSPKLSIRVPVFGYYSATISRSAGKGEMATIFGNRNQERLHLLEQGFSEYATAQGMRHGFINVERYVALSFRDVLGNRRVEYHDVALVDGASAMPEELGREKFREHFDGLNVGKIIDVETATAQELFDTALEQIGNR